MIFQGLKIYQADPIPAEMPCWCRIECTEMLLTQHELYKMVDERADQISAAMQYQCLAASLKFLVNYLVDERNQESKRVRWSCAYVRHNCSFEGACHCQQREHLVMILMRRPRNCGPSERTPMGDLIDFGSRLPSTGQEGGSESSSSDLEMDEKDGAEASPEEAWYNKQAYQIGVTFVKFVSRNNAVRELCLRQTKSWSWQLRLS